MAIFGVATAKLVRCDPPASCWPRQVRLRLRGQLLAARALTACGWFCGAGHAVVVAAAAVMAGLDGGTGADTGQAGKQAGPVEALDRADATAGRRRGGEPPERPLAAGPPPLAVAAAVRRLPERGAGCCSRATSAGPETGWAADSRPGRRC